MQTISRSVPSTFTSYEALAGNRQKLQGNGSCLSPRIHPESIPTVSMVAKAASASRTAALQAKHTEQKVSDDPFSSFSHTLSMAQPQGRRSSRRQPGSSQASKASTVVVIDVEDLCGNQQQKRTSNLQSAGNEEPPHCSGDSHKGQEQTRQAAEGETRGRRSHRQGRYTARSTALNAPKSTCDTNGALLGGKEGRQEGEELAEARVEEDDERQDNGEHGTDGDSNDSNYCEGTKKPAVKRRRRQGGSAGEKQLTRHSVRDNSQSDPAEGEGRRGSVRGSEIGMRGKGRKRISRATQTENGERVGGLEGSQEEGEVENELDTRIRRRRQRVRAGEIDAGETETDAVESISGYSFSDEDVRRIREALLAW